MGRLRIVRGSIPEGMSLTDRMKRKVRAQRGKKRYALSEDGGADAGSDKGGPGLQAVSASRA